MENLSLHTPLFLLAYGIFVIMFHTMMNFINIAWENPILQCLPLDVHPDSYPLPSCKAGRRGWRRCIYRYIYGTVPRAEHKFRRYVCVKFKFCFIINLPVVVNASKAYLRKVWMVVIATILNKTFKI